MLARILVLFIKHIDMNFVKFHTYYDENLSISYDILILLNIIHAYLKIKLGTDYDQCVLIEKGRHHH